MAVTTHVDPNSSCDTSRAIEVADRVWWVGVKLPGDSFQCHTYLIEHGDQSVLIDPGSLLSCDAMLAKVEEVVALSDIRWFVCQHQDPDITAALTRLDRMVTRPDAAIVTHWRAEKLIRHYGLQLPFWLVAEHDWRLDLGGRQLDFVFTPYLHFPGSFVTYDRRTGTLFSSDLFGGFTGDEDLFVSDEDAYFEAMRPFHEHYMPSREILAHGLQRLEGLDLQLIAPQHGKLIPRKYCAGLIKRLTNLDCGLYLMVETDNDFHRLSEMNAILRSALDGIIFGRDFRETTGHLLEAVRPMLPAETLEFYAIDADGRSVRFEPKTRFRGVDCEIPAPFSSLIGVTRPSSELAFPVVVDGGSGAVTGRNVGFPLFSPVSTHAEAVGVIRLAEGVVLDDMARRAFARLSQPLEVAVERQLLLRSMDKKRRELYEISIRDTLTGLYNRTYLHDAAQRLLAMQDRRDIAAVAVMMLDLDHFKDVNDTYGHAAGDQVLEAVGAVLRNETRSADIAVRLGGEEFVVFLVESSMGAATMTAERIRQAVGSLEFDGDIEGLVVSASAGVAMRRQGELVEDVIARADSALYEAKNSGRNRLVCA